MSSRAPQSRDRAFGVSVGPVLLLIAAYMLWRGRAGQAGLTGGIGAVLLVLGLTRPSLLKWPSAVWWRLALALGYLNARVILTVLFVLVLTPVGLLWRFIGRDPLARRRRNWPGWSPSPARYRDPHHYKRMY